MSATTEPDPHSEGVRIESGEDVNIGGDVVGRDKITNVTNITNYYRAPPWAEVKHQRNRQAMLQNVRDFWVTGVLENSLYGAALIRLGLAYQPEAVEQPWNLILRRPEQADQAPHAGTRILDIFDQSNGALLILGAPGSGKTTTLLELARDLLNRAEQDSAAPVPVVFSLSSWAEARPPLADWLVDELSRRYDVPRKIGRTWVEQDMVIPLLDGLDEVQADRRDVCAEAINTFRAEHGLVPLVVCSRVMDYEALSTRLRLRAAVLLQPLTPEQVDEHVARLGPKASTVRMLLATDEVARELAKTPLMLSVMLVAYQDADAQEAAVLPSVEERRTHLFECYVQQMLERRAELRVYTPVQAQPSGGSNKVEKSYSTQETQHWLAWLAKKMQDHNQTMFYLESMQLDWLPTRRQRGLTTIVTTLFAAVLGGLSSGLLGLSGSFFLLFYFEFYYGEQAVDRLAPLRLGLVSGIVGLVIGLLVGLFLDLSSHRSITVVEALNWSWSRSLKASALGALIAILFSIAIQIVMMSKGFGADLLGGDLLLVLLCSVPFFSLFLGLVGGLVAGRVLVHRQPNEGMRRSLQSALIGVASIIAVNILLFGPLGGFIAYYLFPGASWSDLVGAMLRGPILLGVPVGMCFGVFVGLGYGGQAYLRHTALRLLLWRNGATPRPWEYVRFLDYAADRTLLRKVGGGYIFIHQMLLEYFADLKG